MGKTYWEIVPKQKYTEKEEDHYAVPDTTEGTPGQFEFPGKHTRANPIVINPEYVDHRTKLMKVLESIELKLDKILEIIK